MPPGAIQDSNYLRRPEFLCVAAGLLLNLTLPVGIGLGVLHPLSRALFLASMVCTLIAFAQSCCWIATFCRQSNRFSFSVSFFLLLFFLTMTALALLPPTSRDALIHHLAVPKWWLEAGFIYPITWHEWSNYPMLTNLAFLHFVPGTADVLCAVYHLVLFIIFAGVSARFVYFHTQDSSLAAITALICLSMPICIKVASAPLVDCALGLYATVGVFYLIEAAKSASVKSSLLAGAAFGLALSSKYNAVLSILVAFLLFPALAQRYKLKWSHAISSIVFAGIVTLIVASPWLIKNYLWTGNPVHPLFGGHFHSTIEQAKTPSLSPLAQRMLLYKESYLDIFLIPLRMVLSGKDNDPVQFDGVASPLLLFAIVPVLLLAKGMKSESWIPFFALYSLLYLGLALAFGTARLRYMSPIFGTVVVLTALGIRDLSSMFSPKLERMCMSSLIGLQVLLGGGYAYGLLEETDALEYHFGKRYTRENYLSSRIAEYPLIEYVNHNLSNANKVYLLYTANRFYYYDVPVISGGHYSESLLLNWIEKSNTTADLLARFRERGVSHLILHATRAKENFVNNLNDRTLPLWKEFNAQHLRIVHEAQGYALLEIS